MIGVRAWPKRALTRLRIALLAPGPRSENGCATRAPPSVKLRMSIEIERIGLPIRRQGRVP